MPGRVLFSRANIEIRQRKQKNNKASTRKLQLGEPRRAFGCSCQMCTVSGRPGGLVVALEYYYELVPAKAVTSLFAHLSLHLGFESWKTKFGRAVRHDNARRLGFGLCFQFFFSFSR